MKQIQVKMYNPAQSHMSARYSTRNQVSDEPDHDAIRGGALATRLTRQIASRFSQDPQSLYVKNARATGRKSVEIAASAAVAKAKLEEKHPPLSVEQKLVFMSLLLSLAVTETLYMNVSVLLPGLLEVRKFEEFINEALLGIILRYEMKHITLYSLHIQLLISLFLFSMFQLAFLIAAPIVANFNDGFGRKRSV